MINWEQLYENDISYRPPLEAESILLEVAVGCTYAKCSFCLCSNPENVRYHIIPIEKIEENARTLSQMEENHGKTSVFLLGCNAFALGMGKLRKIFSIIHRHMPTAERISMYARTDDVLHKTREELAELRGSGLGDLYIGVESGSDAILTQCRKGATTQDMLEAFRVLDDVGIPYSLSSIIGLGGRDLIWEHATQTAKFYNLLNPKTIRIMTLTPWPGTPLYKKIEQGCFRELTPGQILLEERLFLSMLEVKGCLFIGTHISNNVPLLGFLPEDRETMLELLDEFIVSVDLGGMQKQIFDHM